MSSKSFNTLAVAKLLSFLLGGKQRFLSLLFQVLFYIYLLCGGHVYALVSLEVRDSSAVIRPLLPPHGLWGSNPGHRAWQQAPP